MVLQKKKKKKGIGITWVALITHVSQDSAKSVKKKKKSEQKKKKNEMRRNVQPQAKYKMKTILS